ncbi:MAG: primase-helicase zinc-binding domain-containing protein [Shewanella sp.]
MIDYRNEVAPKMLGLWPEFFANIGIDVGVMRGQNSKNGPCPLCGGEDRSHWRDVDGRLSLYCRSCAADSMKSPETVYMEATGRSFAQFVEDASRFVSYVPNEVIAAKVVQRKTLREPSYCASMPEEECRKVLDENPNALPVFKRIYGKLVVCNVAMPDGSFASGKYSSMGFCIIGEGSETVVTPHLDFANWYASKFDCRVIWSLNACNMREMLRAAKATVRVVMSWDFNDLCELEKANEDQVIELVDMATGLRGRVDSVEKLLDNVTLHGNMEV